MFKNNCYNSKSKIRALRKERNISQAYMARDIYKHGLDVHRNTIASWEIGYTCPTIKDLTVVAKYFGVKVEDLLPI
jgi:DNA-binding XRE family transcriptional regulator